MCLKNILPELNSLDAMCNNGENLDELRKQLADMDEEYEDRLREILGKAEQWDYNSLFNPFSGTIGGEYAKQVRDITDFAHHAIMTSIWANQDFKDAFRGIGDEKYIESLVERGYSEELVQKAAKYQRQQIDNIISIGSGGETDIEWNGFVLLGLAAGTYSYCDSFVRHLRNKTLSSDKRKKLFLGLADIEVDDGGLEKTLDEHERGNPYGEMRRIMGILSFSKTITRLESSDHGNITPYRHAFKALKDWRNKGAHENPKLEAASFEWPTIGKEIKEMRQEYEDLIQKKPNKEAAERFLEEDEELQNLNGETRKQALEDLVTGDRPALLKAIDDWYRERISGNHLINKMPLMALTYPAAFEAAIFLFDKALEDLGV